MKKLGSGGLLGREVIFGWISCLEVVRGCGRFDRQYYFALIIAGRTYLFKRHRTRAVVEEGLLILSEISALIVLLILWFGLDFESPRFSLLRVVG